MEAPMTSRRSDRYWLHIWVLAGTAIACSPVPDADRETSQVSSALTASPSDPRAFCIAQRPLGYNVIIGTSNNDTLIGTPGRDCIVGLGAQDIIRGNGGDDIIFGGDGDD